MTVDSITPPEAKVLPDCPTDGITRLSYVLESTKSLLASSSWDGSVRVHDTKEMFLQLVHQMESGPLLSLARLPSDKNSLVTGGMDGSVRMIDLQSSFTSKIGQHESSTGGVGGTTELIGACSCLSSLPFLTSSVVASAGWHRKFHLWDLRQKSTVAAAATIDLPGKAFSMDADPNGNRIVVATSGRRVCMIDVRRRPSPHAEDLPSAELVLDRESSLKYQTRCVRFFPDGDIIALGSVEGRVAVEYLEELDLPAKGKKYAFKCHRVGDVVYPVNCIEFHPLLGTFATGGCDGTVAMWDGLNKKKLTSLPPLPTSISAMAFNHDGTELAIASSYTFEEGEREHPRDEIYVRPMLESECKPKAKE